MVALPSLPPIVVAAETVQGLEPVRQRLEKAGFKNPVKLFHRDEHLLAYLLLLCAPTLKSLVARPCLVMVDLELPSQGAFAPLRWIRQQALLEDVPIVIFADSFDAKDVSLAAALDVSRFVNKNLPPDALAGLILDTCRGETPPHGGRNALLASSLPKS